MNHKELKSDFQKPVNQQTCKYLREHNNTEIEILIYEQNRPKEDYYLVNKILRGN